MATMRFSLTGVVSRETETGSWVKTIADCLGIRMFSKMGSSESMNNVGWDTTKQKEIQDLHHYAISNLIPRAGVYQMKLLESLAHLLLSIHRKRLKLFIMKRIKRLKRSAVTFQEY